MIIKIITFAGISVAIYLTIALVLIFTNPKRDQMPSEGGLDFTRQLQNRADPLPREPVAMRDGYALMTRHVLPQIKPAPLLVLVHGSGWHGGQFDGLAKSLGDVAEVLVPDLR